MQLEIAGCYLPATAMNDLKKADFGKLKAVQIQDSEAVDFTVLDTFDQSLGQSNRLLIETGDTLELLLADGQLLKQAALRAVNFVADMSDGPVKQALADLSAVRSLLPVGSGTMRHETLTLVDDVEKVQCRAQLRLMTTTDGGVLLVVLQGLRGYDKALAQLCKTLELAGAIALREADVYTQLFPRHPRYKVKPEIAITPDMAAFDAANDIIAAYILVARANESGITADHDTAFLHDYRIALRKIRAVLSLFKGIYGSQQTDNLKSRFSALMAVTGRVRDLDGHDAVQRGDQGLSGGVFRNTRAGDDNMTGEPVEIERKFRVRDLPALEGLKAANVQQGYLTLIDDSVELRLRRADDRHFMTLKSDGGLERLEYEIAIDRAQFETLWPATGGRRVEKTRHLGRLPGGEVFELDVFVGNLAPLFLVEVEFASLEAARSFTAPDWFGTDVTADKRFKNKALAMMDAWQEPK